MNFEKRAKAVQNDIFKMPKNSSLKQNIFKLKRLSKFLLGFFLIVKYY